MADNIDSLPRNPALKRSWLDFQAGNEPEAGSIDVEDPDCALNAIKRSRESPSDPRGNDTGYASSLSEAPEPAPSSSESKDAFSPQNPDSTCLSDSRDSYPGSSKAEDGLWFKVNDSENIESTSDPPGIHGECSSSTSDEMNVNAAARLGPKDEAEGDDDAADAKDNVSEISGLSDVSMDGEGWRPMAGPMSWVHRQMVTGVDPRVVLQRLVPDCSSIPDSIDDISLWKLVLQIISEPPRRKKLKDVNSLSDVVHLIQTCKKIMVLTGAGVSVSCGIPDFRSRDGVYARLAVEYPDLPDPQAMFDISYFLRNPRPFFKFAKELYPGQFEPSLSHRFIQLIESHGRLLRNYTQNIDTLEQVAGIQNVLQCHGSFATATCLVCKHKVDAEAIRQDIMDQVIPHCPRCPKEDAEAIMKPDIVFFGESLPQEFHNQMEVDKDECDLLIVIGSSLKVRPVALIPNSLPAHVPQVLINRESLKHLTFDVELLGDCDVIVNELCHRLAGQWMQLCRTPNPASQLSLSELSTPCSSPSSRPKAGPSCSSSQDAEVSSSHLAHVDSSSNLSMIGAFEKTHLNTPESSVDVPSADVDSTTAEAGQQLTEQEMEQLRQAWQPRSLNLASKLKEGSYLFMSPNRYIFQGAEVYEDSSSSSSSSISSYQESNDGEAEPSNAAAEVTSPAEQPQQESSNERHFGVFASHPEGEDAPDRNADALV